MHNMYGPIAVRTLVLISSISLKSVDKPLELLRRKFWLVAKFRPVAPTVVFIDGCVIHTRARKFPPRERVAAAAAKGPKALSNAIEY